MLSGNQAEPCCNLATTVEVLRVTDRSDQRACSDGTDARDLGELPTDLVAVMPSLDLRFEFLDLVIQFLEVVEQALNKQAKRTGLAHWHRHRSTRGRAWRCSLYPAE